MAVGSKWKFTSDPCYRRRGKSILPSFNCKSFFSASVYRDCTTRNIDIFDFFSFVYCCYIFLPPEVLCFLDENFFLIFNFFNIVWKKSHSSGINFRAKRHSEKRRKIIKLSWIIFQSIFLTVKNNYLGPVRKWQEEERVTSSSL